jgi:hypothetical protein
VRLSGSRSSPRGERECASTCSSGEIAGSKSRRAHHTFGCESHQGF